jgi:hypothetical protein
MILKIILLKKSEEKIAILNRFIAIYAEKLSSCWILGKLPIYSLKVGENSRFIRRKLGKSVENSDRIIDPCQIRSHDLISAGRDDATK